MSVQEDRFRTHSMPFTISHKLRDLNLRCVGSDVVHQSLGLKLSIQCAKFCINTLVRSFQAHSLLQQRDEFIRFSGLNVVLDKIFEMIKVDYDHEPTEIPSSELSCPHTCKAYHFPDLWNVSLICSFKRNCVLLESYKNLSQLLVVSNILVKNPSSFVQSVFVASVSAFLNISLVRF